MSDEDDLLDEQKEYYRARAPEYDDWFLRKGRYDEGADQNRRWFAEADEVREALRGFGPRGRVLELACGTGWWTEELAAHASELTAVDASEEVLERNRLRVSAGSNVRYVRADIFAWEPDGPYDLVFFGFWLSHVPAREAAPFWAKVRRALKPGGRVFFVDSLRSSTTVPWDELDEGAADHVQRRSLGDGREYRVIKNRFDPERLRAQLEADGWDARVRTTDTFFLYAELDAPGASP